MLFGSEHKESFIIVDNNNLLAAFRINSIFILILMLFFSFTLSKYAIADKFNGVMSNCNEERININKYIKNKEGKIIIGKNIIKIPYFISDNSAYSARIKYPRTHNIFIGNFDYKNRRHGKGIICNFNKNFLVEATFENGKIINDVIIKYKNGDVYKGGFSNGKENGAGVLTRSSDKAKIYVTLKARKVVGNVEIHFQKGQIYKGGWQKDPNKTGGWRNSQKHNRGEIWKNGKLIKSGNWKYGKFQAKAATVKPVENEMPGNVKNPAKIGDNGRTSRPVSNDKEKEKEVNYLAIAVIVLIVVIITIAKEVILGNADSISQKIFVSTAAAFIVSGTFLIFGLTGTVILLSIPIASGLAIAVGAHV